MVKCGKCGSENQFDGAAFCKECGANLKQADPMESSVSNVKRDESMAPEETPATGVEVSNGLLEKGESDKANSQDTEQKTPQSERIEIEDPADYLVHRQQQADEKSQTSLSETDKTELLKSLNDSLTSTNQEESPNKVPLPAPETTKVHAEVSTPHKVPIAPRILSVYAHRNKLIFPKSTKLIPGDHVSHREKEYTVRPFRRDPKTLALGGALVTIILVAFIVQSIRASGSSRPTLFGVITDASSNVVLAGASVSIPDLELTTRTDDHGSFRFEHLRNGMYQIRVEKEDFAPAYLPVTLKKGEANTFCTSLVPLAPETDYAAADSHVEEAEAQPQEQPKYGILSIKTNLDDASIIVNGKTLGKGNRTFQRMKPGTHVLQLKRKGYQDFETSITLTPGETTEVVALLDKIEQATPSAPTAEEYMKQADKLFAQEHYVEAIGYYTLAIAKDRNLADAYRKQGEANLKLGRDLKAQADLLSAANIYSSSGKFAEAITCFDRIIGFVPTSAAIFQRRGWAKIYSGDYEDGLDDMEKGLSLDEENWLARFQLGIAYYTTGNYKEAERNLKKVRKYEDVDPRINGYLALTYLGKGDESEARKYYLKFSEQASSEEVNQMIKESSWQQLTALAATED
jgi:tetratricopeptide (TPR) repeat protein